MLQESDLQRPGNHKGFPLEFKSICNPSVEWGPLICLSSSGERPRVARERGLRDFGVRCIGTPPSRYARSFASPLQERGRAKRGRGVFATLEFVVSGRPRPDTPAHLPLLFRREVARSAGEGSSRLWSAPAERVRERRRRFSLHSHLTTIPFRGLIDTSCAGLKPKRTIQQMRAHRVREEL